MRIITLCILTLGVVFAGTGCGTVAKRTFHEFSGASSDYETVPGTARSSYTQYGSVSIQPAQTELGGLVPSAFNGQLSSALRKELTQDKDAPFRASGSPVLTIEPHVMWFNKGGSVFPEKHAIVLYYLKADGAEVGRVQIMTKSEASHTGDEGLANSNAKELAKFFAKSKKKNS